jgi:hypothetical protein
MTEKKRIKVYAFRQFQRTVEKERISIEDVKSGKVKEEVIAGYGKVKEQIITYKKRPYSIIVYRDSKGKFIKSPRKKIKEPEKGKKIIGDFFGKSEYYRASVFAEIPYHDKYYWFGVIVIDKLENIKIEDMKEDLKDLLHKELHYRVEDFWFDITYSIEEPKSYPANRVDKFYEKWSKTKG